MLRDSTVAMGAKGGVEQQKLVELGPAGPVASRQNGF
jgi:hypothetical protein